MCTCSHLDPKHNFQWKPSHSRHTTYFIIFSLFFGICKNQSTSFWLSCQGLNKVIGSFVKNLVERIQFGMIKFLIHHPKLIRILKKYKEVIALSVEDLKGIRPLIYMHKILLKKNAKRSIEHQRRLNPMMKEVIIYEVLKWLNAGFTYAISYSPWVSPSHMVPKKGGFKFIKNEKHELISTRIVTG